MTRREDRGCDHQPRIGHVCWPEDFSDLPTSYNGPCASMLICANPSCVRDAQRWVQDVTSHDGVLVRFTTPLTTKVMQATD